MCIAHRLLLSTSEISDATASMPSPGYFALQHRVAPPRKAYSLTRRLSSHSARSSAGSGSVKSFAHMFPSRVNVLLASARGAMFSAARFSRKSSAIDAQPAEARSYSLSWSSQNGVVFIVPRLLQHSLVIPYGWTSNIGQSRIWCSCGI